jgi:hypothetical protein
VSFKEGFEKEAFSPPFLGAIGRGAAGALGAVGRTAAKGAFAAGSTAVRGGLAVAKPVGRFTVKAMGGPIAAAGTALGVASDASTYGQKMKAAREGLS